MKQLMRHIPNLLSFFRMVAVVPVMLLSFGGYYIAALALFIVAALTDYLDGFLARRWAVSSVLGQRIDQEADKVLVNGTLIGLSFFLLNPWVGAAALLFMARDIYVNGLRARLREAEIAPLPSTFLAKCKTTLQLMTTAAGFLVLMEVSYSAYLFVSLLIVSVLLTLYTGLHYRQHALVALRGKGFK